MASARLSDASSGVLTHRTRPPCATCSRTPWAWWRATANARSALSPPATAPLKIIAAIAAASVPPAATTAAAPAKPPIWKGTPTAAASPSMRRVLRGEGSLRRRGVVSYSGGRTVEVPDTLLDLRVSRKNRNAGAVEARDFQVIDCTLERVRRGENSDGLSGAIFAYSVGGIHAGQRASDSGD